MDAFTPKEFRTALGAMAGQCSIVTVGEGDAATGLIVTSTISPSAEPPLLLACVNTASSSYAALQGAEHFGWSALGAAHEEVAARFGGMRGAEGPARYEGAAWHTAITGARLLADAPVAFDCRLESLTPHDGFAVLIGRVVAFRTTPGAGSLVWWQGRFRALPA